MSATNLNIRTDKEIKNQAEEIFNEPGLNMTNNNCDQYVSENYGS